MTSLSYCNILVSFWTDLISRSICVHVCCLRRHIWQHLWPEEGDRFSPVTFQSTWRKCSTTSHTPTVNAPTLETYTRMPVTTSTNPDVPTNCMVEGEPEIKSIQGSQCVKQTEGEAGEDSVFVCECLCLNGWINTAFPWPGALKALLVEPIKAPPNCAEGLVDWRADEC